MRLACALVFSAELKRPTLTQRHSERERSRQAVNPALLAAPVLYKFQSFEPEDFTGAVARIGSAARSPPAPAVIPFNVDELTHKPHLVVGSHLRERV